MITRIFDTAVHPEDVERGIELFKQEVEPAFNSFDGCRGITMHIGAEHKTHGLVEMVAISTWDNMAAIETATASEAYAEALAELKKLFQQTPFVRHFDAVD
jgi:quinol monooxygenase YgiN